MKLINTRDNDQFEIISEVIRRRLSAGIDNETIIKEMENHGIKRELGSALIANQVNQVHLYKYVLKSLSENVSHDKIITTIMAHGVDEQFANEFVSTMSKRPYRLEQVRFDKRKKESIYLSAGIDYKLTSQYGEEIILERILEKIGHDKNPWCVEFGVGADAANVSLLMRNYGWNCLLIEADRERFELLYDKYKTVDNVKLMNCFVSWHGENALDNLLDKVGIPSSL